MTILATLNRKGGCGKTSLGLNLTALLAAPKRKAAVIDADPQGSATRWARQNPDKRPFPVYSLDAEQGAVHFKTELARLGETFQILLLDTPPELAQASMLAALLADLVLVPVTPSPFDFWGAEAAVDMAREARKKRGGQLPLIVLVPFKIRPGTVMGRELPAALARLGEPVGPGISERVAVVEAALAGQTIEQYAPGSPAHREFQELAKFIFKEIRKVGK